MTRPYPPMSSRAPAPPPPPVEERSPALADDEESELPTKMNALENLPLPWTSETATTLQRSPSVAPVNALATAPLNAPANASRSTSLPPPLPKSATMPLPPPLRRSSRPPPMPSHRANARASRPSFGDDVVTSLPPISPPPMPRIDEASFPRLGSWEAIGEAPPLGLVPIDGLDSLGESTRARPVDDALLEQSRDDFTETMPTRKQRSTRIEPTPLPPSVVGADEIDSTESTTRTAPLPRVIGRSDFGEIGVLRRRRDDRAPVKDGPSEEPSGERERPSPIRYSAPVPSFDDVNVGAAWSDDRDDDRGRIFPAFGSDEHTDSTLTELPSSPWPSTQATPAFVTGSDDLSTAAERAPAPPGRYEAPSWSLPSSRHPSTPARAMRRPSFPPVHSPAAASPVATSTSPHSSMYPPAPSAGLSQAAIAYASSPMFQPQAPTMPVPAAPSARPMRGMWFVAGTAFGVAFMFFATGLLGSAASNDDVSAPLMAPAPTAYERPLEPAPERAPEPTLARAEETVVAAPADPPATSAPSVLAASGDPSPTPSEAVAEVPAPQAEPAPAPKAPAPARRVTKVSHTSASRASSEPRPTSPEPSDIASTFGAALGTEAPKPKAAAPARAAPKRAPADDPDGLMDTTNPADLLGAALKP